MSAVCTREEDKTASDDQGENPYPVTRQMSRMGPLSRSHAAGWPCVLHTPCCAAGVDLLRSSAATLVMADLHTAPTLHCIAQSQTLADSPSPLAWGGRPRLFRPQSVTRIARVLHFPLMTSVGTGRPRDCYSQAFHSVALVPTRFPPTFRRLEVRSQRCLLSVTRTCDFGAPWLGVSSCDPLMISYTLLQLRASTAGGVNASP
ncbi:hypothetical protein B0H15DRAFT_409160 [Mycena belliarum]|uniref:Uncharacterized protein n=1 Tax=Mycena belliarum TaxID=1033014 RepID=A0AAD6UF42_9AGAR|nr:hypothetical protein B0H15DRAFT_409160 [Mycena belliae]